MSEISRIPTVWPSDIEAIMKTARELCKYKQQNRYDDHWTNSGTTCTNCIITAAVEFGKNQPDLQI